MCNVGKLKAMVYDDATVAILGEDMINTIKNKIKKMEGESMNAKEALVDSLTRENKELKNNLNKLVKKIEMIMSNENTGNDLYSLGVMVHTIKTELLNK